MFPLRLFVLMTDVLLGKSRDFSSCQSSLGLPKESLSLLSKNVFFLSEIYYCTSYRAIVYISLSIGSSDFLKFFNNLSRTFNFYATLTSNLSCEFYFIRLNLIAATSLVTPTT